MSQMTRQRGQRENAPPPAKVEDNTLDEQHAGIDRKRRIAVAAYLRAERRGFAPGAELEDWLDAEEVDSQS